MDRWSSWVNGLEYGGGKGAYRLEVASYNGSGIIKCYRHYPQGCEYLVGLTCF